MFARSFVRSAAPLKKSATTTRSYASAPPSSGGRSVWPYATAAVVGVGATYYIYNAAQGKAPAVPGVDKIPGVGAKKALTGGDQGFISLKLQEVEDVNHNTKKFRFALPEKDMVSGLPVASAILTKWKAEGADKPVMRPYTPVSDEGEQGFVDLLIKKYPNGPMSEHIHSMKPGQDIEIKGPLPKYSFSPNQHSHVVMIAGGTGITPMYQVMRYIFNNPADKTKVTLVFGNISEEDILLKREFEDLENTYPQRFKAFYVLDKPPQGWKQGSGHINKDLLKTVMPEPKEENVKVLVCGPPGLYKAISGPKDKMEQGELQGVLKELGYAKEQVYKF